MCPVTYLLAPTKFFILVFIFIFSVILFSSPILTLFYPTIWSLYSCLRFFLGHGRDKQMKVEGYRWLVITISCRSRRHRSSTCFGRETTLCTMNATDWWRALPAVCEMARCPSFLCTLLKILEQIWAALQGFYFLNRNAKLSKDNNLRELTNPNPHNARSSDQDNETRLMKKDPK